MGESAAAASASAETGVRARSALRRLRRVARGGAVALRPAPPPGALAQQNSARHSPVLPARPLRRDHPGDGPPADRYAGFPRRSGLAVFPVPVLIAGFCWLDRIDPEPRRNLVFAFAWGACAATLVALLANGLATNWLENNLSTLSPDDAQTWGATVFAPVIEESVKAAAVVLLFLFRRQNFAGVTDGLVLAGITATGFAFTENILYLGNAFGQDQSLGHTGLDSLTAGTFFVRIIMSPFAHPLFTMLTGLAFGIAATRTTCGNTNQWPTQRCCRHCTPPTAPSHAPEPATPHGVPLGHTHPTSTPKCPRPQQPPPSPRRLPARSPTPPHAGGSRRGLTHPTYDEDVGSERKLRLSVNGVGFSFLRDHRLFLPIGPTAPVLAHTIHAQMMLLLSVQRADELLSEAVDDVEVISKLQRSSIEEHVTVWAEAQHVPCLVRAVVRLSQGMDVLASLYASPPGDTTRRVPQIWHALSYISLTSATTFESRIRCSRATTRRTCSSRLVVSPSTGSTGRGCASSPGPSFSSLNWQIRKPSFPMVIQ
ncbi:hypothetical protein SRIMM317S_04842 [Streptomyces rimosus subsp. rimosus]